MLEKRLEDPSDETRVRLLGGADPEPEVLAKKIEELELRLAEKEEKLLEKDLIFEEVTRLADRTKKKSETGKEDTLELAKKVCLQCLFFSLGFPGFRKASERRKRRMMCQNGGKFERFRKKTMHNFFLQRLLLVMCTFN